METHPLLFPSCKQIAFSSFIGGGGRLQARSPPLLSYNLNPNTILLTSVPTLSSSQQQTVVRSSSVSSNSSFPATSWVSLHQQTNLIYPHLNILLRLPQLNPFFYDQPLPSHFISDSIPSALQSGFSLPHSRDSALRTQSHFAAFASVCHSLIGTHSVVRLQIPPWLCVLVSHSFF